MKIYSRDIFFIRFRNKYAMMRERKVCAPCMYDKCRQLEMDDLGACGCKTQFINEKGEILGTCECISKHGNGGVRSKL